MKRVRLAVAGLGGYAAELRKVLSRAAEAANAPVSLHAVCDPSPQLRDAFAAANPHVRVFADYTQMLSDDDIDAVWLPVPIELHRSFAEQALSAEKAVVVEKPIAGCVQDLDAMDAASRRAGKPLLVGFQDVYDPTLLTLKYRLADGVIGSVRHVSVMACWPREDAYFKRNNWAGSVSRNGVWVMDSPLNNALAHPVNTALWLLGESTHAAAEPTHVAAELYRARSIENFDTVAARVTLSTGVTMHILLTHACTQFHDPTIRIIGEKGSAEIESNGPRYRINDDWYTRDRDKQMRMVEACIAAITGEPLSDRALATPELARPHLVVANGVSAATAVQDVSPELHKDGALKAIAGIEETFLQCADQRLLPHELGLPWTRPAGELDLRGFDDFNGPRTAI